MAGRIRNGLAGLLMLGASAGLGGCAHSDDTAALGILGMGLGAGAGSAGVFAAGVGTTAYAHGQVQAQGNGYVRQIELTNPQNRRLALRQIAYQRAQEKYSDIEDESERRRAMYDYMRGFLQAAEGR